MTGRVTVDGRRIGRGSRVRLRPRGGADVFDLALAGVTATVDAVEEDLEGTPYLVVTVDADPGRTLGARNQLGHRFFLGVEEVEPLPGEAPVRRVLVAGIGNVFHGDDGFGVAVARRLAGRTPPGVDVVDFGIRAIDLAYALQDGYRTAILVDAAPRGLPPGTVSLIEPDPGAAPGEPVDGHGLDPVRVLRLARRNGEPPGRTLLVGCEPAVVPESQWCMELSPPVRAAVDEAVRLIEELLKELP